MPLEKHEYRLIKRMPWMPHAALINQDNISTIEIKEIIYGYTLHNDNDLNSTSLNKFILNTSTITNTFIQRMIN